MVLRRYVEDHHPHMEWGWYNSEEQFLSWVAGNTDAEPSLRVKVNVYHYRNKDFLVNASNGLLESWQLPAMIELLKAAYEYCKEMKMVEKNAAGKA